LCIVLTASPAAWCQKPVINPGGVVNAASYVTTPDETGTVGKGLSGGSIVSIFGSHLAATTETAVSVPLPAGLGGASVAVSGIAAPLLYVSPDQINFQMPSPWLNYPVPRMESIVVSTAAGTSDPYLLDWGGAPGIFSLDGSGCGPGAVLNLQGTASVNSPTNSVSPGEVISVYGTGAGYVYNSPPDGMPAQADPPLAIVIIVADSLFDFTLGTTPPSVYWGGRAPGLIGVDQFNFQLPLTVREGCAVPLTMAAEDNGASQPVTISVRKGGGPCQDPPSGGYGQIAWEKVVTTAPSGSTTEADTLILSLQAAPGKQTPAPPYRFGTRDVVSFGAACPIPGYRSLDAGAVTGQGLGFGPVSASLAPITEGQVGGLSMYQAALSAGSIQPGSFTVKANGGADVGTFQTSVQIGPEIHITTPLAGRSFSQREPITINWTGGDASEVVAFRMVEHDGNQDVSYNLQVPASAGTVTATPITQGNFTGFPVGGRLEFILEVSPADPAALPAFAAPGLSLGGQHTWRYTYRFQGITM